MGGQVPPPDEGRAGGDHGGSPPPPPPPAGRLLGSYESLVTAQSEADPSFLGEASVQLPFGGEWSDVFATFVMINREGRLVFTLKSIYIH